MRRSDFALVFLACAAFCRVGEAQTPPCADSPAECGRKAFQAGVQAFKTGDYPAAVARFREAYAIKQHPAVRLNLALALEQVGARREAFDYFEAVVADQAATAELREQASSGLERIVKALSTVSLNVPAAGQLTVEVDGKRLDDPGTEILLDPGVHRIVILGDGERVLERKVNLRAGERTVLSITRKELTPERPQRAPEKGRRPNLRTGLSPTWFFVATGVSVAVGAVTIWSGVDTLNAREDLDRDFDQLTPRERQQRVDDGRGKEARTNVLLAATGVTVVGTAALGLFFVNWNQPSVGIVDDSVVFRGRF